MKLEEHNEFCRQYEYNMDKGLLKNEWIHLEFKFKINWNLNLSEDEKNKILRSAQMGIHELMEKSNREEENVIFTNPYISKDKIKWISQCFIIIIRKESETKEIFHPYKSSKKDLG